MWTKISRWTLVAGILTVAAASAFLVTQQLNQGSESRAQQSPGGPDGQEWPPYAPGEGPGFGPAFVDPPGEDVTPEPGATPDTSQPWWWVPWENAERGQPIFEGEIAGIRIQRDSAPTRADRLATEGCEPFYPTPWTEARGTPLDPEPSWLPANSELVDAEFDLAIWCGDDVLSARAQWRVPPREADRFHGANILIYRYYVDGAPAAMMELPEGRWFEGEVAGRPAAFARPLIDMGKGQSALVLVEGEVVTQIVGDGLTVEQLTEIARGLLK